jgi:hypothetical protein
MKMSSLLERTGVTFLMALLSFGSVHGMETIAKGVIDPHGCTVDIEKFPESQGYLGEHLTTLPNFDACKNYCLAKLNCYAVDYNTDANNPDYYGCWWYDKPQPEIFIGGEYLTYYRFLRSCPFTTREDSANAGADGTTSPNAASHLTVGTFQSIFVWLMLFAVSYFL